jgi:BlaI family penicillinase repressor
MPRKASQQPTEVELRILTVLWERGASTVREVHDSRQNRATGYSTTLKMMQVMHQKGVLKRDDSVRPQIYRPARSQTRTQQGMVDQLVSRAFGGAAGRMLVQALSSAKVSDEDLAEIKALIEQMEEKRS